jgi:hypothetical protein
LFSASISILDAYAEQGALPKGVGGTVEKFGDRPQLLRGCSKQNFVFDGTQAA